MREGTFGSSVPDYRWKWTFNVWIKNGTLYVMGVGKCMWNQNVLYDVGNKDRDWTSKRMTVLLNVTGGSIDTHALGTKSFSYKTTANKGTTIK